MLKNKSFSLEIKSISDTGEFSGYASVFGVKDSHSDIVMPGAFQKSLDKWAEKGSLPAMLWMHDIKEPIGVYTVMKEDDVGLYVEGRLLIDSDRLAKRAHAHLKAKSISGLSIGFIGVDEEWSTDKGAWLLKEIDLWEVSLVTFPSNDESRINDVKAAFQGGELPKPALVEKLLRDAGFSRSQSKAFMADGYKALRDADTKQMPDLSALKSLTSMLKGE